ncbi:hypothetical protein GDO81_003358 [Engystomops pustulosus]|uniref:Uncharacterized protein n=1 Tax=Engystomops pustulosus TaxID=76066 RepID=A0AAV6ZVH3_ENGPU|nr:hypothetical protein GDO81_003358 [Engystomops pustulosus]
MPIDNGGIRHCKNCQMFSSFGTFWMLGTSPCGRSPERFIFTFFTICPHFHFHTTCSCTHCTYKVDSIPYSYVETFQEKKRNIYVYSSYIG